jgi:hypothetical protein
MLAQVLLRREQWQQRALQLHICALPVRALVLLLLLLLLPLLPLRQVEVEEGAVMLLLLLGQRLVAQESLVAAQPLSRPQQQLLLQEQQCQLHLQQLQLMRASSLP